MSVGRSAKERLDEFQSVLDRLIDMDDDEVILVEGRKDRGALILLGVQGEILQVQSSDGLFSVAERLAKDERRAIIMTDWDRKGGHLCLLLKNALKANEVPYDDELRKRLVIITRQDIKDVQSLASLYARLVQEVEGRSEP
ncbi:MAG: Toprim subdomain protein [Methanomassiliicoccales archaeon]|nr:Toprim subdomain protein [Methanomassiliicoccales archaeon]